ncbi:MAG: hypothetical protein AB1758_33035, partial [Candidatus Eremiobacterota bacterium]
YRSHAEGANLALLFDEERGTARVNFLHASDDAPNGLPRQTGLILNSNIVLQWVNPNGFYLGQLGFGPQTAGMGSSTDVRPVSMLPGFDGNPILPGLLSVGGIGPQDQTSAGVSLDYTLDHERGPRFFVQWAHSDYRPNKLSAYSASGDALRAGAEATLVPDTLELAAEYLRVDPTYDPYLLEYPLPGGIVTPKFRLPYFDQLPLLYSLHDTRTYPQNRQGLRARLRWWFSPQGQLKIQYGRLSQTRPSVQDVRFSPGSLGPGIPNSPVLGFSPGFMEPFFFQLSPVTFAPSGANRIGAVLESPRGRVTEFSVDGAHAWDLDEERKVRLSGIYLEHVYRRDSAMASLLPGAPGLKGDNENFVDIDVRGGLLRLDWDLTPSFSVHGAYALIEVFGHFDTQGVYTPFAQAVGQSRFTNVDVIQHLPELGFDWDVTDDIQWGLVGRYLDTTDRVNPAILAAPNVGGQNLVLGMQTGAHPFSWDGWQVQSVFSVKL